MIFQLVLAISFFCFSIAEGALKPPLKAKDDFVEGTLFSGRLGNQFFEVAAALSLAMDHQVEAYFPDFKHKKGDNIPLYAETVFFRLNQNHPPDKAKYTYRDNDDFTLNPIPYQPKIKLLGYYQSEYYFAHNWAKIRPYFEASEKIKKYLRGKYAHLIDHPKTVAMHVRDYVKESAENVKYYWTLDIHYLNQAMSYFDADSLFVVFSDNIEKAKALLQHSGKNIVYIENERDYHDFFLMSFMKHQIISNSTFSWWAAYLNDNPFKIVIAPKNWFTPTFHVKSDNIVPKSWIQLE